MTGVGMGGVVAALHFMAMILVMQVAVGVPQNICMEETVAITAVVMEVITELAMEEIHEVGMGRTREVGMGVIYVAIMETTLEVVMEVISGVVTIWTIEVHME